MGFLLFQSASRHPSLRFGQTGAFNNVNKHQASCEPGYSAVPKLLSLKKDTVSFGEKHIDDVVSSDIIKQHGLKQLNDEILAQPMVLQNLLNRGCPSNLKIPNSYSSAPVLVVAIGSSLNAASTFKHELEAFSGKKFELKTPEEILQQLDRNHETPWHSAIIISQSGESANVVQAAKALSQKLPGLQMVTLTNSQDSTLARTYQNNFNISAGEEKSVPATKSMTATMLSLLLLAQKIGQQQGVAKKDTSPLRDIPYRVEETLQLQPAIQAFAKSIKPPFPALLISKGPLCAILPEAKLKLQETMAQMVSKFESEEFKHGPRALLENHNLRVLYVIPPVFEGDTVSQKAVKDLYNDIGRHYASAPNLPLPKDNTYFIRFKNSPEIPSHILGEDYSVSSNHILTLPEAHNGFESAFMFITAIQQLAHGLVKQVNRNPNHPLLVKQVTF